MGPGVEGFALPRQTRAEQSHQVPQLESTTTEQQRRVCSCRVSIAVVQRFDIMCNDKAHIGRVVQVQRHCEPYVTIGQQIMPLCSTARIPDNMTSCVFYSKSAFIHGLLIHLKCSTYRVQKQWQPKSFHPSVRIDHNRW